MKNNTGENIELTLPVNPAYVSAIRLTASSISNRMRFDVDEIEDIKSAVSEACAYIIKKAEPQVHKSFKISFTVSPENIKIHFQMNNMEAPANIDSEMSLLMIKALSDEMMLETVNGALHITILKVHKKTSLT